MESFRVIPAVDLLDGKIVRLYQGDYSKSTIYGEDPAEPIQEFIAAGSELIHLVDLNAARSGERGVNENLIRRAVSACGDKARLELGGGIRNIEAIRFYRGLGLHRLIIGSAAMNDPEFLEKALDSYGPECIIVGVDAKDGRVRVSGWEKDSGRSVEDALVYLEATGAGEVIFTDIKTDGAMTGPAVDSLLTALAQTSSMHIIASGGIANLDDIRILLDMKEERLCGVITGRALYEKKLNLKEATDLARSQRP